MDIQMTKMVGTNNSGYYNFYDYNANP